MHSDGMEVQIHIQPLVNQILHHLHKCKSKSESQWALTLLATQKNPLQKEQFETSLMRAEHALIL